MNEFLSSRYVEVIHRLALGIEPIDAQHGRRLSYPLQMKHDAEVLDCRVRRSNDMGQIFFHCVISQE